METKTILRDKSLRDIWTATDKSTIDILQDTEELSQNLYPTTRASSSDKPNDVPSLPQSKKTNSYFDNLEKKNLKDVRGLFQPDICKLDDDNVSLYSIWTPTNNDNLRNKQIRFYESPLIDQDLSKKSSAKRKGAWIFPTNSTYTTSESPLIDLGVPENQNIYTASSDNNHESLLIDLGLSENSYTKPNTDYIPRNDCSYRNISRRDSGSKLNHDSDSEKSLDELNEETFGKFSYAPKELELTLADISDATAAYGLEKDKSTQNISRTSVYECSETTEVREVQEMPTGTRPKTYITKVYKNNMQQSDPRENKRENIKNKNPREKYQNVSNPTNVKSNSGEILSVSREDLAICKARPIQGKFRRNFANNDRRRMATRTRETFHSQVLSNEQAGLSTHTRETFHKKGNKSYYTTEKIIYIRGEKLENAYKKHEEEENNIVWRNVSAFSHINDREASKDYDSKIKKYFTYDTEPQHYEKGKKLPDFDIKSNHAECRLDTNNITRLKNRSITQRQELRQSNYLDHRKPSKIEIRQGKQFNCREKTAVKCIRQSSTDNSDVDEPISIPQNKNSGFINNRNRNHNVGHNDKENVIHFKIYDPKLRRPTKKKIMINQYREDKFKSNLFDNPQTRETGMQYTKSGGIFTKDPQEQLHSKNASDTYPKQMKLKNNLRDDSQNGIQCATSSSMNIDLRDHFEFLENINLNKADKENKTFVKEVLCDVQSIHSTWETPTLLKNSTAETKNDVKKHSKSSIINDGKEISDLIVGCQRGLDMFKPFYNEWIELRKQSISLLEQMVMIIDKSSRKSDTMKHVIAAINIAVGAANFIPHPGAQLGAKVAGAVGGFLASIFNRTDSKKDVNAKQYEIKEIFQRDIDSSSYVYLYGVQCGSQFQETCNVIRKFHKQLLEGNYQSVIDNDELLEFLNEITEHNSLDAITFYKRLRTCYERLIKNSNSADSRAFVRIFEDVPEAISVIDLLPWKFDSDGFDNTIIQNAWEEIFILFQVDNPETADMIKNKIQNCLFFLKKEQRILSRNVTDLFKEIDK